MKQGTVFLDFEFSSTAEKTLNLVCCSTTVSSPDGSSEDYDWWLHNDRESWDALATYLHFHRNKIFYAWSVEAEARSMLALKLDVIKFQFIDLFLEYRMIQNHDHTLLHGKQLIDGVIKDTYPYGKKGEQSLAAATYKLLGQIIDTEHKTKMRDLIISSPSEFTEQERIDIMRYCRSDIKYLPALRRAIVGKFSEKCPSQYKHLYKKEALLRGEYAARTAKMLELGYPVNLEQLYTFSSNVPSVLETACRDINSQFIESEQPFRWNKKDQRFSLNQKIVKDWIRGRHGDDWVKTDGEDISLALESFTKKYHYAHEYPEGHLAAQMIRFLKLKQSMNGFNPNAEKNIFHSLGSDGRIRCYLNPFGAQSSRTQPASTAFIFLKPAWQRSLVQPKPGKAIGDYDWSSEEFLLSALMSGDRKMLAAYRSGDVYLAFGKMIGWIPKEGTKASHKYERDVCKSLVLGLSYLMTKYGLARKLTDDTGKVWTEEEAQVLVEQFEDTFDVFAMWRNDLICDYQSDKYVRLADGWYAWGDNDNERSVGNMPIQGMGACIMRKAVALAQDAGLDVIFTLHDAIYIEYDSGDYSKLDVLKRCMDEAFIFFFEGEMKEQAKMIRVDGNTWGPDYEDGVIVTPNGDKVTTSKVFIDPRAIKEFNLYSRYMTESLGDDLLA